MQLPRKIHFTCKDKHNIDNPIWKDCLNKYYAMYSDYEIIVHDNADIYNLIETHFPQYLEKIKQITIGAVLADIFRYLILYLEGGIYSDLDCEPIQHIDKLFDKNYQYFHGDENRDNNYFIYNNKKIINRKWDFNHNVCNNSNVINDTTNPVTMKCLGHRINIENSSVILCYELHSDWLYGARSVIHNNRWCYKEVTISQWFMISEPKQEIFIKMFMNCMEKIDFLINLKKDNDFLYNVNTTSGPLAFTRTVVDNLSDKITILPSDFFCSGACDIIPLTKNSFISHKFTGSWLK